VVVVEKKGAGTVMVKVEHGEKLQAKENGRNVLCAGGMGQIIASTVTEQAESE
jgi:succinate dehydrogenase/fumarate reductase flavoprotein subunit